MSPIADSSVPPRLLVLNPNTSPEVTRLLQAAAERAAASLPLSLRPRLRMATAPFGPRYITGEVGAAVAAHAAMECLARDMQAAGPPSAVLLACFGDPGLFALRALAPCPVVGLAEASMRAAAQQGPFVVLTGGAAWVPMLERLALSLDLAAPLLGVHALPRSGGEMAAQPEQAVEWLVEAGLQALQRWPRARALLVGGAGLAGLAAPVAARLSVPVLDNVDLALQAAFRAAMPGADASGSPLPWGAALRAEPGPWSGLGPGLAAMLPADPV